jgi:nucleoid-associated protein YgaU
VNELTKLFWGSVTVTAGFGLATLFGTPDSKISDHHPFTAGGTIRSTIIDQHPMGPLQLRDDSRNWGAMREGLSPLGPDFNQTAAQASGQLRQQEPQWLAPTTNQPTIRVENIRPHHKVKLTAVQIPEPTSTPTAATAEFYITQNSALPVSFQPATPQPTGKFPDNYPAVPTPPPLESGSFPRPLATVADVLQATAKPPWKTPADTRPPQLSRTELSRTGRRPPTPSSVDPINDYFESHTKVGPVYASTNPSMRFSENSEPIFSNGDVSTENFFSTQSAAIGITINEDRPVPRTHIVVDGDSLKKLASRYLDDPHRDWEIFKLNHDSLQDPELLPIGAVLKIPDLQQATAPRLSSESVTVSQSSLVLIGNVDELIPVRAVMAPRSRPQAQLLRPVSIKPGGNPHGN